MASEILGSRWTIVLLRELCAGSTRFNDLRRGVPRMSPALLAKRLKELRDFGVLERRMIRKMPETFEYVLTPAGEELKDVIMAIGIWGQRWVESHPSLENADPSLLMWDMRRNIRVDLMPSQRSVVQFSYNDQPPAHARWWMICDPEAGADLCAVEPGFDIDLYVQTDLRTMTAIWMGVESVAHAQAEERLHLVGHRNIAHSIKGWLGLSPFAKFPKRVK